MTPRLGSAQDTTGSMRFDRRRALTMALSIGLLGGCASTASNCAGTGLAYVGTEGDQLRALRLDACAGKLAMIGVVADVPKPRWTVPHPVLPILYAASDGYGREGSVVVYAVDRTTGALTKTGEVAAGGGGTTHLWLDAPSMTLLAANFGSGTASSIALAPNGSLGVRVSTVSDTGSGPHRRQAGPHAHGTVVDPSGRYALVTDFGADRVFVYRFDRATRTLSADDATASNAFIAPPGSGPRRAVFGATGHTVYVLDELTAETMVLRWNAAQARLTLLQTLPTGIPDMRGTKSVSEIALSPDGRFVYVGDRGQNALVVYRVSPDSGELAQIQRMSSGGEAPWHFEIHPSGRWMLVANYRSHTVNLFHIDPQSGMLSATGESVEIPAPLSVGFMN